MCVFLLSYIACASVSVSDLSDPFNFISEMLLQKMRAHPKKILNMESKSCSFYLPFCIFNQLKNRTNERKKEPKESNSVRKDIQRSKVTKKRRMNEKH